MRVVITGGGTGGHVFAGVAIAQEFRKQDPNGKILFIGSDQGLETKLVPKAGFELTTVKVGKLMGQSTFAKILTYLQLPRSIWQCMGYLKSVRADVVVGVGGYASGPCIVAAWLLRIPTAVLEQNAVMGYTNQLSSKFATRIFTAFEEVPAGIDAEKCYYTGNPIRSELKANPSKTDDPFTLFIFGGSQGAKGINRMMLEAAEKLVSQKSQIKIVHQTGPTEFEFVKKRYQEIGYPAEVHAFIDDMQSMYHKASLVICRAGSGTISELAATKNAAILIPFPFAAGGHQLKNAQTVERAGGALLIEETNQNVLADAILQLKSDPQKMKLMREKIAPLYKTDSAVQIVSRLKELRHV